MIVAAAIVIVAIVIVSAIIFATPSSITTVTNSSSGFSTRYSTISYSPGQAVAFARVFYSGNWNGSYNGYGDFWNGSSWNRTSISSNRWTGSGTINSTVTIVGNLYMTGGGATICALVQKRDASTNTLTLEIGTAFGNSGGNKNYTTSAPYGKVASVCTGVTG